MNNRNELREILIMGLRLPFRILTVAGFLTIFAAVALSADQAYPANGVPIVGVREAPLRHAIVNFTEIAAAPPVEGPSPLAPEEGEPPRDLPVPTEVHLKARAAAASASPMGQTLALASPAPSASFAALGYTGGFPPDTDGAAGPNHLMTALNGGIRIQSRSGQTLISATLDAFWSPVRSSGTFDPKIIYDPLAGRWITCAVDGGESTSSGVLIGVSATNDPTGTWYLYRAVGDVSGVDWADQPQLGFNKNWIVLQVNMYPVGQTGFDQTKILVFSKSDLYAHGLGTYTVFSNSQIGGAQSPAESFDSSIDPLYLLQKWNGNSGGMGYLRIYSISGAIGNEVFTPIAFASTQNTWDSVAPDGLDFAPQFGSSSKIDSGDARITHAVFRSGALWASHTVYLPAGGSSTRSAVQWWQVSPAGDVLQFGRIDDPTGVTFAAYPSLAVNRNGDALLGFSTFSANQYASGAFALHASFDPSGASETPAILKAGEEPYFIVGDGTRNRWGDYSSTAVDPVNDTDFWTIQEYAATSSTSGRWATWWGLIKPPAAPSGFPDLTPYQPQGWSDRIVVTNTPGQTFDSSPITSAQALYVNWAVLNSGTQAAGSLFYTQFFIDGVLSHTWFTNPPLNANHYTYVNDYSIGSLAPGTHSIKILTDSTGVISESNESNNAYVKTINVAGPLQPCVPGYQNLCLANGRFKISATFETANGSGSGSAAAISLTGDTGAFWFFKPSNYELMVKVINGCSFNSRYWVFVGGLTNVKVTLTVTDTQTGAAKTYVNPQGATFQSIQDTAAFATCP
jgi:hypothetical protein